MIRRILASSLVAISLLALAPSAEAATRSTSEISRAAKPAVVLVSAYRESQVGSRRYLRKVSIGSGFFVTANGYVVTNRHVVSDRKATYTVDDGDDELSAKVVYRDDEADVAVLKVSGSKHKYLKLSGDEAEIGDKVVGIGNAEGEDIDSVSKGTVTGLNFRLIVREDGDTETLSGMIRTSARQYHGDSGGPLLDTDGKVLGINTAIGAGREARTSSYVTSLGYVRDALKEAKVKI